MLQRKVLEPSTLDLLKELMGLPSLASYNLKYQYQLLFEPIVFEGVRLAIPEDIAPMKLAAITGRGKRKDFYDFYYLLQHYSLDEMFSWYDQKYPDGNRLLVYRSITYFEDAESEEDPYLFEVISWEEVKSFIATKAKGFLS